MELFTPTNLTLLLVLLGLALLLRLWPRGRRELDLSRCYEQTAEFLTPAERNFYRVLVQAVDDQTLVFAKVRIADVLLPKADLDPEDRRPALHRISSKHFDFVLCDATTLHPLAALELDDSSHQTKRAQKADAVKNAAAQSAGFPLLRVTARKSYRVQDLSEAIAESLG